MFINNFHVTPEGNIVKRHCAVRSGNQYIPMLLKKKKKRQFIFLKCTGNHGGREHEKLRIHHGERRGIFVC